MSREAALSLAREVEALPGGSVNALAFHRIERPVDVPNPLAWLAAQTFPVKGYWADRDGVLAIAALGEADIVRGTEPDGIGSAYPALLKRWEASGGDRRYFGGVRFDTAREVDDAWKPFGSYRFILPLVEVVRNGRDTVLACHVRHGDRAQAKAVAELLQSLVWEPASEPQAMPRLVARLDHPDRTRWDAAVDKALKAIESDDVQKVVLARRTTLAFMAALDTMSVVRRIEAQSESCSIFCGSYSGQVAFIGASPERLFRRRGNRIESEAVAGTRPRGTCPEEDTQLEAELRASVKDAEEHAFVVRRVRDGLAPLCSSVESAPSPMIRKLRHVQHLVTPVEATMRSGVTDADVLRILHPTPAVGGEPRDAALATIRDLEPFDRGWYAAPVGWISAGAADFVVALRCGVVVGNALSLFSGAGIVRGSRPGDEWNEVEAKMRAYLSIAGV